MNNLASRSVFFADSSNVYQEMDTLIKLFLRDTITETSSEFTNRKWLVRGDSLPRLNIFQEDDKFVVEAVVAGIPKENIKVEIENSILTFSYEKQSQVDKVKNPRTYFYKETSSASFKKYVALPQQIDIESAKTTYDNGVIKVTFDVQQKALKKTLPIE